jgi:Bacterial Ig-like domain (group 3)
MCAAITGTFTPLVTSSFNPAAFGQAVTFTATINAPGAGGTVTFSDGATVLGNGTAGGLSNTTSFTFTTSTLGVGAHSITAAYSGDFTYGAATSSAFSQTINSSPTTTTISSSAAPSSYGQSVTITVTVATTTGGLPTGSVTLSDNGTQIGSGTLSGGTWTFTSSTLSVGAHNLSAAYAGVTGYLPSSQSAFSQAVNQGASTTTVASSQNPSTFGQSVTLTASVNGSGVTPTGTVTFMDGATTLGSGSLVSGSATFTTSALAPGNHSISVVYGGDTNYTGSTSSALSQAVNQAASTTVVASPQNPSVFGQSVTFTVTVTASGGTPTGTVTFKDGATTLGTGTLAAGAATLTTSALTAGGHSITVVYGGDTDYSGSTSLALTQVVNQAAATTAVAASPNPSTFGQSVTFTATVTGGLGGTPTGTVTFKDGATTLGTGTLASGAATFATAALAGGSRSITAVYGGDSNYLGSTSSALTQAVNQAGITTAVASSQNPSTFGQSVTFTATLSGGGATPTGTVTFLDGATPLGSGPLAGGSATFSTSSLTPGSHSITGVYSGDPNYTGSTSPVLTQTIIRTAATTLASSQSPSSFGQSVTLTATVTGGGATPTGTVTFKDGATALGTGSLASGSATFATSSLTPGSHSLTAVYAGDANYAGNTSSVLTQAVNQAAATVALASSQSPSIFGQAVTFTATVTGAGGTPTGTVTFKDGVATLGTSSLSSGSATFAASSLTAGSHSITVVYAGDINYTGVTSPALTQIVNQAAATTSALSSSRNPSEVGQAVTFTATVTSGVGTPGGTVTFNDGGAGLGSGTLAGGIATLTVTTLTRGSHSITAVYAGNANFITSTSAALIQAVDTPADSLKLRALQLLATKAAAQNSGQAISSAVDAAIADGFNDGGQFVTPGAGGMHFNFTADPDEQHTAGREGTISDRWNGTFRSDGSNGAGLAGQSSASHPVNAYAGNQPSRIGDVFASVDRNAMPGKAPARISEPKEWMLWADVGTSGISHWGSSGNALIPTGSTAATLYGSQVNALMGLTRKFGASFLLGVLGGYETFDYRSDGLAGRLKGEGWTAGSYLGWKVTPNIRFDAAAAYSGISYDGLAGAATGNFDGNRWLISSGLTGGYHFGVFDVEPSARVYALWEHENAYTDSLGTMQSDHAFFSGRASGGTKLIYPMAWTSTITLAPYVGLYGDYYFNGDDAAAVSITGAAPLASTPFLAGWSARATGGLAATLSGGATMTIGAELGGIGGTTQIWTFRGRGSLPF